MVYDLRSSFSGALMANRAEVDTLLAVHQLMRRDADRLVTRIESSMNEPRALAALARWFGVYRSVLAQHHEVEDHILFPAAARYDHGSASIRRELGSEHEEMEELLEQVDSALRVGGNDDAPQAARRLKGVLDEHLVNEERWLVPLANQLSDAEFHAVDRAAAKMHPLGDSLGYLGWMVDGMDSSQRANFFGWQPRSVRLVSAVATPFYRRRARAAGITS